MDQKTALRLLRKKYTHKKSRKAHAAFVRLYMDGEIKWKVYQDECEIFYRTAKRWYDFLENEREKRESANFAPQLIAEADIKSRKPSQNTSTFKHVPGKRPISASEYVTMLEKGMRGADEAGDTPTFKILAELRNKIVDVAAELPTTHLDIERTVGMEGLLGMDGVLAETLSKLVDHADQFPKTMMSLRAIFKELPDE